MAQSDQIKEDELDQVCSAGEDNIKKDVKYNLRTWVQD